MKPTVYSFRTVHQRVDPIPEGAVYVGRGMPGHPASPWGNPEKLRRETGRQTNIVSFWKYAIDRLQKEPRWLVPLKDKHLVCWCHGPHIGAWPCHADVLLFLANGPSCVNCDRPIAIGELAYPNPMRCPECRERAHALDVFLAGETPEQKAPPVLHYDGPIRTFTLMPKRDE